MRDMITRFRIAWTFAGWRRDMGIPMRRWWRCVALPYILTGKCPDLSGWKIWEG